MSKKIINVSDLNPNFNWLEKELSDQHLEWEHHTSATAPIHKKIPKNESIARAYTAMKSTFHANKDNILVSHGPRPTMYISRFAKTFAPETPILSVSFTFTELPTGSVHKAMAKAYQQPARFLCYSTVERQIYADYFDIPIEKIDMIPWSMHHPVIDNNEAPYHNGRYICALGTEGRDYKTLFEAMKALPNIQLVVVATWASLNGIDVPDNVKVVNGIPLSTALNILQYSDFMVLPLKDKSTTCGHSSLASSMFYKKSILITNAPAIHDYIEDGVTGLYFEQQNVTELKEKIESLWDDPTKTSAMNEAAYNFAVNNCTERGAVEYFKNFLKQYT